MSTILIPNTTTSSLTGVTTLNQGFINHEIEDTYVTHLDLNGFCTMDNNLEGVVGDIRRIDTYTPAGSAEDVAEGQGNSSSISVGLDSVEYRIKCAQAWFQYSDEAYMRDPIAVQTGLSHLGVAMFNKVNADIQAEFAKAYMSMSTGDSTFDFDNFVDAVSMMTIKDAAGENAMQAQQRFVPTVWAMAAKGDIAKIRKSCANTLQYIPEHAWTPGYIGDVAGVTLFYRQDLTNGVMYVGTNKAVTVFNKTGVQTEQASRAGGQYGAANTRMNDFFARKYYIAALTDATQLVQLGTAGATLHYRQSFTGDGVEDDFTATYTPTSLDVYVDGVKKTASTDYTVSTKTVTFTTAPALGANIVFDYSYTAS